MRVVFVRQFVHLTTYFFIATDVKHTLAELLVADEPVVDTQEELLLAFLLERVRDEVLVIPWRLPVTVPVGSPFLYVVVRNGEEIHGVLDKFLVLLRSVSQEVPARAILRGILLYWRKSVYTKRSFWPHYDASQSKPLSLSFARELELDRSMLLLSALPVRALLPTSSNALIGLSAIAFFDVPWAHISCHFLSHH